MATTKLQSRNQLQHGQDRPAEAGTKIIDAPAAPNILIIDDDPALVRMIRLTLESEGFQVSTAPNGVKGLEVQAAGDFSAIVLDLQMPIMDGRTFYRELRARGVSLPVLILSAYGADAARAELQAQAAINKPFDPDTLIETIHTLVAEARTRDK